MAREFTSLGDITSAIEGMGFKIGDVWYDGNRSRPVFVCSREGLPHDIEVWAESPKYVNGVTIKDVPARDFDMVDGGEDAAGLKKAIRKALAYMGAKESKMKITVKEAKIYTTDDFKAAAEEERFKNCAEIWADQFNRHAEYIGLKDRARVEKDLHGCDSVVWDYGYIVAKDPFGEKWQVRFGDNAYTMDKYKVTPYVYRQMDSMTGFKGESRKNEASDSIRVYDEDLMVELTSVERYDDRFTDVPVVGDKFDLLEFRTLVEGLAETSNGYPDISRDGSELRVAIEVPQDEGDEYREELVLRGVVHVVHASVEQVVEYLDR